MPPDTHIEMLSADAERMPEPPKEAAPDLDALAAAAADLGAQTGLAAGNAHHPDFFSERHRALRVALRPVLATFRGPLPKKPIGDDFRWVYDNLRLLHSDLRGMKEGFKLVRKLPHVRTPDGVITPRVLRSGRGISGCRRLRVQGRVAQRLCAGLSEERGAEAA